MVPYLVEECWEFADAVGVDPQSDASVEELGDVLFVALMAAHTMGGDDVLRRALTAASEKMRARHPHVFVPGAPAPQPGDWGRLKPKRDSALDGVPASAPALHQGQEYSRRAATVGFDWPDWRGVRDKVDEELAELDVAIATDDHDAQREELGDLLMTLTTLARKLDINAESALRDANRKFRTRFVWMEQNAGQPLETADADTLDGWWRLAKDRA
jgi:MazG family protein